MALKYACMFFQYSVTVLLLGVGFKNQLYQRNRKYPHVVKSRFSKNSLHSLLMKKSLYQKTIFKIWETHRHTHTLSLYARELDHRERKYISDIIFQS